MSDQSPKRQSLGAKAEAGLDSLPYGETTGPVQQEEEYDAAVEKRLCRKIDINILPWICFVRYD